MREFSFDEPNCTVVEDPEDYCASWPVLPIYNVTVNGFVTSHVLESVAQTTRLTTLVLHYDRGSPANLSRLAAALKHLNQLQELNLAWPDNPGVRTGWSDEAKLSCVSALLELPELSTLWLRGLPLPCAAAEVIGQLQELTTLRLVCCDVDDYCVNVIALTLTGGWCRISFVELRGCVQGPHIMCCGSSWCAYSNTHVTDPESPLP